jgi:choline-sulfatase
MAWKDLPTRPNILLVITDQMRYPQHWPMGWASRRLRSLRRLQQHGLSFRNAFCAANECSPSRGTFMTSTYPEHNHVTTTPPQSPPLPRGQPWLPEYLPTLGRLAASAGYQVAWKGKWHLGYPSGSGTVDALQKYGFGAWNPPDAGTTLDAGPTLGGGTPNNDLRIATGVDTQPGQTPGLDGGTGATQFLDGYDASGGPFFLVVSLVNPHDVHVYTLGLQAAGYPTVFPHTATIGLPASHGDDLANKPSAQLALRNHLNGVWPFTGSLSPTGYAQFYAYLNEVADGHVQAVLDTLQKRNMVDDTLVVRFGDHGEMGMAHGLREKMYVAYEEAIRVPLVFSNPRAFPLPRRTDALASLVDLLPTLATVMEAPLPTDARVFGTDLSPVLERSSARVQRGVVYTFDDNTFGGHGAVDPTKCPTVIRCLRTERWKYAVYVGAGTQSPLAPEFELYDLVLDRPEMKNLLGTPVGQAANEALWQRIHKDLTKALEQLRALPPNWPAAVGSAAQAAPAAAAEPVPA